MENTLKQLLLLLLLPRVCFCSNEEEQDFLTLKHKHDFSSKIKPEERNSNRGLQSDLCPLNSIARKTYQDEIVVLFKRYCVRVTFGFDGVLEYDNENEFCEGATFTNTTEYGTLYDFDASNSTIFLQPKGRIVIKEDPALSNYKMELRELPTSANGLLLELILPVCFEPSQSPSKAPSMIPTATPSLEPTVIPSASSSVEPSLNPSVVPSVPPSFYLSDAPTLSNLCPRASVEGYTYKAGIIYGSDTFCLSIKIALGETLLLNVIDNVSVDCSTADFDNAIDYSEIIGGADSTMLLAAGNAFGSKGIIVIKEDPALSNYKMELIQPPSNADGYVIYLILPACFEPSQSPSKAPSMIPTATRSLEPTVIPSASPSVEPSLNPSVVPSVSPSFAPSYMPTREPSSAPSIMPSLPPTNAPSLIPSSAPSLMPSFPTCTIDGVRGRTFLAPVTVSRGTYCFRLEITIGGIFEADTESQDCATATFENTAKISTVQFLNGSRASLVATQGIFGNDGIIVVREDSNISAAKMAAVTEITGPSSFEVDLILPSCTASSTPSIAPSNMPSQVPNKLPSYYPSAIISKLPSRSPSETPAKSPSQLPSVSPNQEPSHFPTGFPTYVPSQSPTDLPSNLPGLQKCPIEEVLGKTYIAPMTVVPLGTFCFRLELVIGGTFEADFSSDDCATPTFANGSNISTVRFAYDSKAFLFASSGSSGYGGIVVVREDSNVSDAELRIVSKFTKQEDFEIDLVLPSCTAPSNSPSVSPSVLPTNKAQSELPTVFPSKFPSNDPSQAPSETPTETPSNPPSIVISKPPSSMPSFPTCPVEEAVGKIYVSSIKLPLIGTVCARLELFIGGVFEADSNSRDCAEATFESTQRISVVNSISGSIATADEAPGLWGYGGTFVVREDSSISGVMMSPVTISSNTRDFEIDLLLKSCYAPSIAPTAMPTPVPTALPSECPLNTLIGGSRLFSLSSEVSSPCYRVEFFENGNLSVDTGNEGCKNPVFKETSVLSTFKGINSSEDKIEFVATETSFWSGVFEIKVDRSLEGLKVNDDFSFIYQKFVIELIFPTCPQS